VPFAAAAWWLSAADSTPATPGQTTALAAFITGVFLLSFAHQPLTLALVYGDPAQFRLRRAVFVISPFVFVAAIIAGYAISFVIVAVVGALWNAEHTLMQRYGLTRVYGRMAGQDDGRIEKVLLFSWLIVAALWVMADPATPDRARALPLGENNTVAIDALGNLRSVALALLVPAAVVSVVAAVLWVRAEVRRPQLNPLKWLYLGSTLVLFVVIIVNPIVGIMGYVGAHAVEYFVTVHQSLGRRYASAEQDRSVAGAGRPGPHRALGFLGIYITADPRDRHAARRRAGSPLAYAVVFFTLGGLHVFYDGFIWKLRRPAVAHSLAHHLSAPTAALLASHLGAASQPAHLGAWAIRRRCPGRPSSQGTSPNGGSRISRRAGNPPPLEARPRARMRTEPRSARKVGT
jgi:hypothetical protein